MNFSFSLSFSLKTIGPLIATALLVSACVNKNESIEAIEESRGASISSKLPAQFVARAQTEPEPPLLPPSPQVAPPVPANPAKWLNGRDRALSIFYKDHSDSANGTDFLSSMFHPATPLTDRDRKVALGSLAMAAVLDQMMLARGKFEAAPKYRTMHVAFTFLAEFQKTEKDTPDELLARLIEDWKRKCIKAGIQVENCGFNLAFEQEDWLTPIADFSRPLGDGKSAQALIQTEFDFYRSFEPAAFGIQLYDEINDAEKHSSEYLKGYVQDVVSRIETQLLKEADEPGEKPSFGLRLKANLETAFLKMVDDHVPAATPFRAETKVKSKAKTRKKAAAQPIERAQTAIAPDLRSVHRDALIQIAKSIRETGWALRPPLHSFAEILEGEIFPKFETYARKHDFIRLSVYEAFVRRGQYSWLKRKYVWVPDAEGADLQTPYGESVSAILAPGWVRKHPGEARHPLGKLYRPRDTGPTYGGPQASYFYSFPWGRVNFVADRPPAGFWNFFQMIQRGLDSEYLSMKRKESIAMIERGETWGMEGYATPSFRMQTLQDNPYVRRTGTFGVVRVPKGVEVAPVFIDLASKITPANPENSARVFRDAVERAGLSEYAFEQKFSDRYSPILTRKAYEDSLAEAEHSLLFRREYREVRAERWMGKTRDAFQVFATGETFYIVLLSETRDSSEVLSEADPRLNREEFMSRSADHYARDRLQKKLLREIRNVELKIDGPEFVQIEAPSAQEMMEAILDSVDQRAEIEGDRVAWRDFVNHLSYMPLRPRVDGGSDSILNAYQRTSDRKSRY